MTADPTCRCTPAAPGLCSACVHARLAEIARQRVVASRDVTDEREAGW